MGLFSGIKKAVKKVFKGVKKVFKKIGKFVGKILNSKWGKALMVAAAVFTGGMALAAGWQAAAGATGFAGKFMAGAKAFMGALVNPIDTAKEMFGGAAQGMTTGQQIAAGTEAAGTGAAEAALGATGEVAADVAVNAGDLVLGEGTALADTAAKKTAEVALKTGGEEAAKKTLMQKAGGAALDLAKTAGGGQIISGAIEGYAGGAAAEEQLKAELKEKRHYDKAWGPGAGLDSLKAAVAKPIDVPQGYLRRAMDAGEHVTNFTPRVRLSAAGG